MTDTNPIPQSPGTALVTDQPLVAPEEALVNKQLESQTPPNDPAPTEPDPGETINGSVDGPEPDVGTVEVEQDTREPHEINPNFTGGHQIAEREATDDPRVVIVDGTAVVTGAQPDPTYDEKDGLIGPKGPTAAPVADGEPAEEAFIPAQSLVADVVEPTTAAQVRTFDEADTANRHAFAASQAQDIISADLTMVSSDVLEAELARRNV